MNAAELTALWTEISRTARPGARVIFRTAADERLLPGSVPERHLEPLALRRGGEPRLRPAGPLIDLRRLPPLRAQGRLSHERRRGAHGRDVPPSAAYLRSEPEVLSDRPGRGDSPPCTPSRRWRARDRLRHGAQPDQGGARLPRGALLRARRVARDARHGRGRDPARRPLGANRGRSGRRHGLRSERAVRPACFRARHDLLRALDDPAVARGHGRWRSTSWRRAAR